MGLSRNAGWDSSRGDLPGGNRNGADISDVFFNQLSEEVTDEKQQQNQKTSFEGCGKGTCRYADGGSGVRSGVTYDDTGLLSQMATTGAGTR